eukprot:TRINITY_DN12611_c0_g1_i1.p1 TRINITY_DN12611_c0_g1~~TRINITY_DN12611_c0_g1_i1.p1  ORF type:complete len:328 (-),score=39.42 TRINITY_DN12611_c0_g1_i1:125-1108(-)
MADLRTQSANMTGQKSRPSKKNRESPKSQSSTGAWSILSLLLGCTTVAFNRNHVTVEQGALSLALPAACAWKIHQKDTGCGYENTWASQLLRIVAAMNIASVLLQREGLPEQLLPTIASIGLAAGTSPHGKLLSHQKVPVLSMAVVLMTVFFGSVEMSAAIGLAMGRLDGWPLAWAALCAVSSLLALSGWSLYVKGDHGRVQDMLGPMLSPRTLLPIAIANATLEEVEFRMLTLGSLLAGFASTSISWVAVSIVVHSIYFAVLHYLGGFPSGRSGFALVLVWSTFLGILRYWTGGMGLVLLLHVQADIVIFILVMAEERKRAPKTTL